MTPATIHALERKAPALAFFAAISLLASPVAITTASAHGGDKSLVHACVGRDKLVRAVGPSKKCKELGKAVHLETEPSVARTVVDSKGAQVGQTFDYEVNEATVRLSLAGTELELELGADGFRRVLKVSGSDTLHFDHDSEFYPWVYPDSANCSGIPYIYPGVLPAALSPLTTVYARVEGSTVYLADPRTQAPRVLPEGAAYSVESMNGCVQGTVGPGAQLILVQISPLGDLDALGFVPPFRLQ